MTACGRAPTLLVQAACKVLSDFGVPYECTIVSAHRTPARMYEYAQSAANRGLKALRHACDVWCVGRLQ